MCSFLIAGVQQEQLLHEAAIKDDVQLAKKLIESRLGINSKTHVRKKSNN